MATAEVRCHGCRGVLHVPSDPVPDPSCWRGSKMKPKLTAPFLCDVCRADPVKFKAARKELEKLIGPEEPREGFS